MVVALVGGAALLGAGMILRQWLARWQSLLIVLLLVILFVPIRRFVLPGNLPFHLELYRLFLILLFVLWAAALWVDPRVRLRRTGLDAPILAVVATVLASILVNLGRIEEQRLDAPVLKSLSFFVSFIVLLYMLVSLARSEQVAVTLLKVIVAGGAVIGGLAVIEQRTGFNAFNHVDRVLPFLKLDETAPEGPDYLGRVRATGPAEHPIALSALLAMMVPLAGYFAWTLRRRVWWVVMGLILIGCVATVSRTGVIMLIVEAVVFCVLRPQLMKRLWPAILPLLLAVHFALPGTLGSLKDSFFPSGGIVREQQGFADSGRLGKARLDPTFRELDANQILGVGFGSRVINSNAQVLDDQWLDTALETGIVGVFAWLWLFVRFVRRVGREARRDLSDRGLLLTALVAAVSAYGVSMLLYDAFGFIEVTLIFYTLMALGCALALASAPVRAPVAARAAAPAGAAWFGAGLIGLACALLVFNLLLGPSLRFLVVVLGLAALAWSMIERGALVQRDAAAAPAAPDR